MEYLNNKEAFEILNAMTDEELVEVLKDPQINIPFDIVNGVLIDRENIIKNLTGINPNPNVRITYSWNGQRTEQKIEEGKPGCRTCG